MRLNVGRLISRAVAMAVTYFVVSTLMFKDHRPSGEVAVVALLWGAVMTMLGQRTERREREGKPPYPPALYIGAGLLMAAFFGWCFFSDPVGARNPWFMVLAVVLFVAVLGCGIDTLRHPQRDPLKD